MKIALGMLFQHRLRTATTILGLGAMFFLSAAQVGLLVGWCNTTSAIIRHAPADLWVMARQTPAFDYGTAIPRNRIYQVRSVEGVAWSEGMFVGWNYWQRPDGRRVNIEVVGLDQGLIGGPWLLAAGEVGSILRPDTVLVDELYMDTLGVERLGQELTILDRRALVGGISRGVRTFTTTPFVFTSIKSAIRYDRRYRDDDITYVLAGCVEGHAVEQVRAAVARDVPHVEVLTSAEFAARTVKYWMLGTGAGITVVVTAILGLLVGAFITSQTLFTITQDYLANYAMLIALGFRRGQLSGMILTQGAVLGGGGIVVGSAAFFLASHLTSRSPIPLETTAAVFAGLIAVALSSCLLAALTSIRSLFTIDPLSVFRV